MGIPIAVGAKVPLFVSLEDLSPGHVVFARIISRMPYDILADEILLEPEYFDGDYTNFGFTMPDLPFIDVIYSVFDDDGYTLMRQEREIFVRQGGSGGSDGSISAHIHDDSKLTAKVAACT